MYFLPMPADPSFRMTVEDVFPVRGRGMVATGQVEAGVLKVGDEVRIHRQGAAQQAVVIAIDAFQKQLQQAGTGDNIGALLRGVDRSDIQPGDVVTGFESERDLAGWGESDKPLTIFRNDPYGFEFDLPRGWAVSSGLSRIPVILSRIINRANILEEFSRGSKEYLNIVVEPMQPESPPDINELVFTLQAQQMNYTDVRFNRIIAARRVHTCASYVMNGRGWLKKYMVVVNGHGYAFTASCPLAYRSSAVEDTWDRIVASFRLLKPVDESVIALNTSPQAHRSIELLRQQLRMQVMEFKRQ